MGWKLAAGWHNFRNTSKQLTSPSQNFFHCFVHFARWGLLKKAKQSFKATMTVVSLQFSAIHLKINNGVFLHLYKNGHPNIRSIPVLEWKVCYLQSLSSLFAITYCAFKTCNFIWKEAIYWTTSTVTKITLVLDMAVCTIISFNVYSLSKRQIFGCFLITNFMKFDRKLLVAYFHHTIFF